MYEWLGLIGVCVVGMVVVSVMVPTAWSPQVRQLVLIGAALRLLGAMLRYEVIVRAYGGAGDALHYYAYGEAFAGFVHGGDIAAARSMIADQPQIWGTQFLQTVTALVVTIVGPTIRGTSAVFALLGYGGVVLIARAAAAGFAGGRIKPLVTFLFLWPSLWFWPSSIGKESLILLGIGLVVSGVTGARVRWSRFAVGVVLAFLVRPHVAALLVVGLAGAEVLGQRGALTAARLGRLAAVVAIAALVANNAAEQLGVGAAGGTEAFMETRGSNTETGGSRIERPSGVLAVPTAFVNVLVRPFPWEARNAMSLLSAFEMTSLWVFAWRRRRSLAVALRDWRRHRLLRTSLVFIVVLTLAYGLNYGNLGIIARQRVVIFPFLFIVLGAPLVATSRPIHSPARAR